jgi:prevent-host-death family protein
MKKSISIVQARRGLGRLAEEVRRTGDPIILTRRGRPVARLVPEPPPSASKYDALGALRGTIEVIGTFDDMTRDIRLLRDESARNLNQRSERIAPRKRRRP